MRSLLENIVNNPENNEVEKKLSKPVHAGIEAVGTPTSLAAALDALRDNQVAEFRKRSDPVGWLDFVVDTDITGNPITRRTCIRLQCGELALSYAESAVADGALLAKSLTEERDSLKTKLEEATQNAARYEKLRQEVSRDYIEVRGEMLETAQDLDKLVDSLP